MLDGALAPGLLLATVRVLDPQFARSVVLLAVDDANGTFGWILNGEVVGPIKPLLATSEISPSGLLLPDSPSYRAMVRRGGPVSPQSAWVIFRCETDESKYSDVVLSQGWCGSGDSGLMRSIAIGEGPEVFRVVAGYAKWQPGQLHAEVAAGAWLPVRFDPDVVFSGHEDSMWRRAYEQLVGVSPIAFMSTGVVQA